MNYRQLGNAGVRVSVIGMGTNQFGRKVEQAEVNNVIDAAQDCGINFIDTADVYGEGKKIGFIPYFPLAGGFLTGKYKRGQEAPAGSRGESSVYVQRLMTDDNYDKVEKLTAWAEERDHTMAELAHAWLLAQPQVCSVISGLTRLEHLQANAKAAGWVLTAVELNEINQILDGTNQP